MTPPKKPRKNNVYLGFQTGADIGTVVPARKGASPYNTRLSSKTMHMQGCCRCFSRTSQGACSGHFAEMHSRLFYAELVLKTADEKVAALEDAFRGLSLPAPLLEAIEALVSMRNVAPEKRLPRDEADAPAKDGKP